MNSCQTKELQSSARSLTMPIFILWIMNKDNSAIYLNIWVGSASQFMNQIGAS